MHIAILVVILSMIFFAVFAKKISTSILTAPMFFLAVGYFLSLSGVMYTGEGHDLLYTVAEATLIVLLFIDAARTDLSGLQKRYALPARMLFIGLPLMVAIGTVVSLPLFPEWPFVAVVLMAALLAPTDVALGQAVVSNIAVPSDERRTLIIESGLNDGLVLPIILFFSCTLATIQGEHDGNFLIFTLTQLVVGPIIGMAVGYLGAKVMLFAAKKNYTEHLYEGIAALGIAASAYLVSDLLGGNGFIAVFVAGLMFGYQVKDKFDFVYEFVESEGQILVWVSFLLIGLVLMPFAIQHLTLPMLVVILLSLFVVRPLAIFLSLLGTETTIKTRLFFGWFGPRGLATAVFALLVVGEINQAYAEPLLALAINAVWISALLHGISAGSLVKVYAKLSQ